MESIGGYRIIRRLGSGHRSDVFLGHAGQGAGGTPQLASIKVFRDQVPERSIDAEISALSSLDHPHIVQLLDLATGPGDRPSLILRRLEPTGLARLLADRVRLEPGEVVTILAPIVAAVRALHSAGVTHGGLGASAVLFDGAGAPVLCGFGSAGWIAQGAGQLVDRGAGQPVTQAQREQDPGVAADLDALAALVALVIARVQDATAPVAQLTGRLGEPKHPTDFLPLLERALFAFADATPVAFGARAPASALPSRFDPEQLDRRLDPSPSAPVRFTLPSAVADWVTGQTAKLPEWLAALPTALRAVRKRVWALVGAGLAAVVLAGVLLQQPAGESVPAARHSESGADVAQAEAPPSAASDDPVAAAVALLEHRARCLGDRSLICLDAVHQPDSGAWQADAASILAARAGAEIEPDRFAPGPVALVERMGDTALLALESSAGVSSGTTTASVLMVRTEAGWRLRSLTEGAGQPGG